MHNDIIQIIGIEGKLHEANENRGTPLGDKWVWRSHRHVNASREYAFLHCT